ncbi:hypothetical protein AMJ52_06745 [candidate division TA06 bacterium DG_78]|uniref:DUF5320 domain-containing protein n=1 Tax=candidate division TA06 bacterium DG_78 TaxID=1703772 RepID=A0A0S7YC14_UNCT6|nr:MAG: hypothetical protein AMJ52_06745 [candidate division TA06 bacterium DG_78]
MPGGDRTGPLGYGPMTGRGVGYCAGYSMPGYANPIPGRGGFGYGRGFGRGRGWFGRGGGRGWRHWYYATGLPGFGWPAYGAGPYPYVQEPTPKEETQMLMEQAEFLKNQLKDIQDRIGTLEKAQAQEKK